MAEFEQRTRYTVRTEYVLRSGAAWGELHKMVAAVTTDLGESVARWDDAAFIEARDDEIVIWYDRTLPEETVRAAQQVQRFRDEAADLHEEFYSPAAPAHVQGGGCKSDCPGCRLERALDALADPTP